MTPLILETSAIRRLSRRFIDALGRLRQVQHSPYAFFEVYSHLDEDFHKFKTEVLKFERLHCLETPLYELASSGGVGEFASPMLRLQKPNISELLDILRPATSLDEFRTAWTQRAQAGARLTAPAHARDQRQRVERDFSEILVTAMDMVTSILKDLPGWTPRFRDAVMFSNSSSKSLARSFHQRGASVTGLQDAFASRTFLFWAYTLNRALHYVTRGGIPDPNDAEDAYVLLHLDVNTPATFVCSDTATASNVNAAVTSLNDGVRAIGDSGRCMVVAISAAELRTQNLTEVVRIVAYDHWMARGGGDGLDVEDWMQARNVLRLREDEHA